MGLMDNREDLQVMQEIANEIGAALTSVMEHSRDILKRHIDEDVYDHSIYTPKVYKRRSENEGMGVSLAEQTQEKPYTQVIAPALGKQANGFWVQSRLWFHPSGEHKYKKWNTANDSELMGRIEKKDPEYSWGQNEVPQRPFWQRFVDEMVDGGELEKSFVDAMSANEIIEADGSVIEDPHDRTY